MNQAEAEYLAHSLRTNPYYVKQGYEVLIRPDRTVRRRGRDVVVYKVVIVKD